MKFEIGDIIVQRGYSIDSGLICRINESSNTYKIYWYYPSVDHSFGWTKELNNMYVMLTDIFRGEI